jgi:DNA-binding MarR family transcriptional regulator
MATSTPHTATDSEAAVHTFVSFMTAFGSAQQILKTRMHGHAEPGLGPLHLRALCLCQRNPGAPQQQLVQAMGRDKGQIARLIRDLEDHQLLLRTPDERDRRVWLLTVTPEGEQKATWFAGMEAVLAQDLFGALTAKEAAQLDAVLQMVQARIDAMGTQA